MQQRLLASQHVFQAGLLLMLVAALASAGGIRLHGLVVIALVGIGGGIAMLGHQCRLRLLQRARQHKPFETDLPSTPRTVLSPQD